MSRCACFMSLNVDSVCQSAHYHYVIERGRQFLNDARRHTISVSGGIASAHQRHSMPRVKVAGSQRKKRIRRTGHLPESTRIRALTGREDGDTVVLTELEFAFR